jgi:hypothetical protein
MFPSTFWRCLVDVSTFEIKTEGCTSIMGHFRIPSRWMLGSFGVPRLIGIRTSWRLHGLGTNLLTILIWLVVYPSEKYESQWEGLSHILWKIKNVWNHQPVMILCLSFAVRPIRKRRGWVRRGASTVRTEEQCSGIWNARMSPMYYTIY